MLLKALHIFLAFNVLLSTTGIVVFEHLCQMKGKTASVFVQSKNCCSKKGTTEKIAACQIAKCCKKNEPTSKGASISPKPCCEDNAQFFKSETDATAAKIFSIPDFKFQPLFAEAFLCFERSGFIPLNPKTLRFYLYKPPPKLADIRLLIQSFRC